MCTLNYSRFFSLLSVLALFVMIVSCSGKGGSKGKTADQPSDVEAEAAAGSIDYSAYDEIVSFIIKGFNDLWKEESPQDKSLSAVYSSCSERIGYLKKDINGDSIEELLIAENIEGLPTVIYDIFTFDRVTGTIAHPVSGGGGNRFYISEEGLLVEEGESSAGESLTRVYSLKGSVLEEQKDASIPQESLGTLNIDLFSNYTDQR